MNAEQSIAIMKALADKSRLAIVNSLLERHQYVEELAKRHGLAASTVSFHLKKLEQAGLIRSKKEQYYVMLEANEELLETPLKEIISAAQGDNKLQQKRIDEYQSKVLNSFFRHGILDKLPAQHKKRLIVLEQFVQRFEPGRRYTENEVTDLIRPLFDDYCTIRRLLIEENMLQREGTTYWRDAGTKEIPEVKQTHDLSSRFLSQAQRAELKRQYLDKPHNMGIFQIRNKSNGKIYIDSTSNLEAERKSREFQLKMGKIVFNRALQAELREQGAENFVFEVLDTLKIQEPTGQVDRQLMALKLRWQEKLQPFEERGYNSRKGFEREKKTTIPG